MTFWEQASLRSLSTVEKLLNLLLVLAGELFILVTLAFHWLELPTYLTVGDELFMQYAAFVLVSGLVGVLVPLYIALGFAFLDSWRNSAQKLKTVFFFALAGTFFILVISAGLQSLHWAYPVLLFVLIRFTISFVSRSLQVLVQALIAAGIAVQLMLLLPLMGVLHEAFALTGVVLLLPMVGMVVFIEYRFWRLLSYAEPQTVLARFVRLSFKTVLLQMVILVVVTVLLVWLGYVDL